MKKKDSLNHRAFVEPRKRYDIVGAMQFDFDDFSLLPLIRGKINHVRSFIICEEYYTEEKRGNWNRKMEVYNFIIERSCHM